jgi:cytochrome c55X
MKNVSSLWRFALAGLLLFTRSAYPADGGDAAREDPPAPARQTELRHLVRHDCGSCHGLTLAGGLGPALNAQALADKPVEYLQAMILRGRPGTAMPGWNGLLSDHDARWIAEQLKKGFAP